MTCPQNPDSFADKKGSMANRSESGNCNTVEISNESIPKSQDVYLTVVALHKTKLTPRKVRLFPVDMTCCSDAKQ